MPSSLPSFKYLVPLHPIQTIVLFQMHGEENVVKFCPAEQERLACLSNRDTAGVQAAELKILANLMHAQYGNAVINATDHTVTVQVNLASLHFHQLLCFRLAVSLF